MYFRSAARLATTTSRTAFLKSAIFPVKPSTPLLFLARTMATNQKTLLEAVAEDHQEMYDYYDQYVKNAGNPEAQTRWVHQFTWEVARHAVGEELVVYPLMEKHLGLKGRELADTDRGDHSKVKELLYDLESYKVGTTEHAALLKSIVESLKPHNDSEEKTDLPLLMKAIGSEASISAAQRFKRTKKFAPTRPHPAAPDKPPFETLAGLMAAPIDKLRDIFETFPSDEELAKAKKENEGQLNLN